MSNVVAIIGRPNVGKSTLFNRLVKRREAIVDPTSGVTRDRHYGNSEWNGKKFTLIDTGGYLIGGNDRYEKEIHKQVKIAIDESDCILFLVDVEIGLNSSDMDVAKLLRQSSKPVFLVVNKVDNSTRLSDSSEFYSLGISKQFNISAINGSGTGDLLDELVKSFTIANGDKKDDLPRFAVIGRPNAGKSSFINSLIDEKRNIVNHEAGTTRDSIETYYNKYGFNFYLVDTAGIRKKSKILENIEFYSVMRSIKSIENSDVCILIYDACREFDSQVKNIFWLAAKNHKGIVIVVNKWDLIDKKNNSLSRPNFMILLAMGEPSKYRSFEWLGTKNFNSVSTIYNIDKNTPPSLLFVGESDGLRKYSEEFNNKMVENKNFSELVLFKNKGHSFSMRDKKDKYFNLIFDKSLEFLNNQFLSSN